MSGVWMHEDLEQQLHQGLLERKEVFRELSHLFAGDSVDRCVAVTGAPGMGKTAILVDLLRQCSATNGLIFAHFVRRQHGDKIEPWAITRSLAIQLEQRFPHLRAPCARAEARLGELLLRVTRELNTQGQRLVLAIDGLDECSSGELRELLACFPRSRLGSVRLLLAGSLHEPLADLDRYGQVAHIDLDDPGLVKDNEAVVRAFWHREQAALSLDDRVVERAIHCAAGNMLHATLTRKQLADSPPSQQSPAEIQRDLASLLTALWQRVAADRAAMRVIEVLCAAREPLSIAQLGRVAGWNDPNDVRAAVKLARVLLAESRRDDGATVYILFHDAVRRFAIGQLGAIATRGHHGELAESIARWPASGDAETRRYALRHALAHRIACGDSRAIELLASNIDFLDAKCRELGVDDVEFDIRRAARACLTAGHMASYGKLDALGRSIARESSALDRDTGTGADEMWRRVRRANGSSTGISATDARSADAGPVAERHDSTQSPMSKATLIDDGASSFPAPPLLVEQLVGRGGAITACAITPDSRRVIAAYSDHSMRVWDLDSKRLIRTLTGHAGRIRSCVVTPDGRLLISASADATLKIWELNTGALLTTLGAHADAVNSCALTPDGRWLISASSDTTLKVWDLKLRVLLATLEGHTSSIESCAVTPDGRCIISAAMDTTLRVWDLKQGTLLATWDGHTSLIGSCAVTPDGRRVVFAPGDQTVKVWDLDAETARVFRGHSGTVTSCSCAPDSQTIYSASSDSTIKAWNLETGAMTSTLGADAGPVTCCAVAPNGRLLVSGSSDSKLKVWRLDGASSKVDERVNAESSTSSSSSSHAQKHRKAKQLILFLAANPKGANRYVLEEECAAIERELRSVPHGSDFEFRSKWAVTVDEMARHLLELDPVIVHFRGQVRKDLSGSDSTASTGEQPCGDSGIYLHDEQNVIQLITGRALRMIIKTSAPSTRVVVLNACYSDQHADELCREVDCVVGMTRDHGHAARSFAVAFYRALGNRKSIGAAIEHAAATLALKRLPEECAPRCKTPSWLDPNELVLNVTQPRG